MAATELQHARSELEDAAETADDDMRDELSDAADTFAELATETETVDHAILDQHLNHLRQLSERAEDDAAAAVDRAIEHAEEYREDLEQA